ncbi:hypothetical protein BU23DRAFT_51536 [Bimuria novae-zelandiae CBS 107.79]|uniref:Uncharacterized protein n=1 Tax=Bimuria novae-zelandiae CBS 107.79 TaxID=1447943 RepID=A0A6A5UUF4_9PLEO|nr:hypothetical protein BU23DRAFT_51536 [Bimuria novae-zelandiae CBS 107.79]
MRCRKLSMDGCGPRLLGRCHVSSFPAQSTSGSCFPQMSVMNVLAHSATFWAFVKAEAHHERGMYWR